MKLKFLPIYLVSLIPLRLLYILSDVSYFLIYSGFSYRLSTVRSNLKNAFPEKSDQALKKIEKKFYRHFCDVFFESIKSYSISKNAATKRYRIKNPELMDSLYQKGNSVVIYAAHLGNWEWFAFLPMKLKHQVTSFYQELSNSYFDELMKTIRERFGVKCIESKKGYRSMLEFAKANTLTANIIIGDQSPRKSSAKHWTTFLNQETAFLIGAEIIARKSGMAVVFPNIKKIKRGHYEVEFILLEEHLKSTEADFSIIDKFAQQLEKSINESPHIWLWSHKRWKLKKEASYSLTEVLA